MPIVAKAIFTVGVVVLMVALCFVKSEAGNAGSNWFWRLGKIDPLRNLLLRPDGSLKRFTKDAALAFFGVFLLVLWFIVPTAPTPH